MNKLLRHPDIVGAVAGLTVMAATLVVLIYKESSPVYLMVATVGLIALVIYLLFRNKLTNHEFNNSNMVFGVTAALIVLIVAVLFYVLRVNQYEKPLVYYILVATSVGILFYSTLYESRKKYLYSILVIACMVGLMHIWTESMMFSGLIGIDPWGHQRIVTQELEGTSINFMDLGYYPTLWHFYLGKVMELTGLDYRISALLFMGSLQMVGNLIFSFLIGRELFNMKIGVIAALMLANANWNITFGEWIIPNGIGATFVLATIYLMLKRRTHPWFAVIVVGILALSYLTHIVNVFWVTGTIICFMVLPALFVHHVNTKHMLISWTKAGTAAIVLLGLIFCWFTFTHTGESVYRSVIAANAASTSSVSYITAEAPTADGEIVLTATQGSTAETLMNMSGILLFMGVSLIGTLIMTRNNSFHISYAVLGIVVTALGVLPTLFGIAILQDRWQYLAAAVVSVPLSCALVYLTQNKHYVTVIMSALVACIVFLSIMGPMSNLTQRALFSNQVVRYGLTDKEMEGLLIADSYEPKKLGSDSYYLAYVSKDIKYAHECLEKYIFSGNFRDCQSDVILLRDALYREPFGYGGGAIYKIEFNPAELAAEQGYKEVYSNGDIHCLIRE